MTTATGFLNTTDLTKDDYCVFGLATCFLKQDGELITVQIVEPIPSAALEAILQGIPTSYRFASALTLGDCFNGEIPRVPAGFPDEAQLGENFIERAIAATRTYKSHPRDRELIPAGTTRDDLHFSLDKKRVLNAVHVVRTEDNVKQHSHTHKVL
ncbi:hypothetical protein V0288_08170 [Pannus brasiliensis CCIBt3594]|uniref:Uncharacterized protein n=1 Tax=Pannus brasiliensis CCIBt3594 TaxID=1427578 RepID=A0AAW9QJC3_9CHRO